MDVFAHLDLETRSRVTNLNRVGLEVYAAHESSRVTISCYAIGSAPIETWTFFDETDDVLRPFFEHVRAGRPVVAHNKAFEFWMWNKEASHRGWPLLRPSQLFCTMAQARAVSLPAALGDAAAALNMAVSKDKRGKQLIQRLSKPMKSGLFNEDRALYAEFAAYCRQDVAVERRLHQILPALPEAERRLELIDFKINNAGVFIDLPSVGRAMEIADNEKTSLNLIVAGLTGGKVGAASEVANMLQFLEDEGVEAENLKKDVVARLLRDGISNEIAREILEIRKQVSKTSTAKLKAMTIGTCADSRARGLLAMFGADTWRWAGRRIQTQNMVRPDDDFDGEFALELINLPTGRDALQSWYGNVLDSIAQSMRSFIATPAGRDLMACDYSNIEGRVLAWVAGEQWKMQAFREFDAGAGHDLYKLAYAASFGISPDEVSKPQRQIGKVQELALGYGGGKGAFASMAANYGIAVVAEGEAPPSGVSQVLTEAEVEEIKKKWRAAHPETVRFWKLLENAATNAVAHPGETFTVGRVAYRVAGKFLLCRLPSGRNLTYPYPSLATVPDYNMQMDVGAWGEATVKALKEQGAPPWLIERVRKIRDRVRRMDARPLREAFLTLADEATMAEFMDVAAEALKFAERADQTREGASVRQVVEVWGRDKKTFHPESGKPMRTRWGPWRPYGGLYCENIVQALARDLLAAAMLRLDDCGYNIVMHVHDEIVTEQIAEDAAGANNATSLEHMRQVMCELPSWAKGLPIAAAGWRGKRYRK